MDTHTSSRRALKLVQEQEMVQKREDRAQHAAETSEQRSEKAKGEGSCAAQTASEKVQRYGTLNEAMKMFNSISTQDCHTHISPSIRSYLSFHCPRETGFNDT